MEGGKAKRVCLDLLISLARSANCIFSSNIVYKYLSNLFLGKIGKVHLEI